MGATLQGSSLCLKTWQNHCGCQSQSHLDCAMGDDKDDEEEDESGDEVPSGQAAKEAKQLDSITDYVEEKETSKVDTKEVEARLNDLRRKKEESDRQHAEREKQLAQVRIKKEDLELMCTELPLCEREALER